MTRGRADVRGALPTATARRARLLRSARAGRQTPPGGAGAQVRHPWRSATTTTGSRASGSSNARSTSCLRISESDFPFCICWANENWSRRWDGSEQDILMEQKHLPEDPVRFIGTWRRCCATGATSASMAPPSCWSIARTSSPLSRAFSAPGASTAEDLGSGPCTSVPCRASATRRVSRMASTRWWSFLRTASASGKSPTGCRRRPGVQRQDLLVHRRHQILPQCRGPGIGLPVYRGLMSGWDNTARRGYNSHIFHDGTPQNYEVWLRRLLDYTRRHHPGDHRLVFVNAWNEWGEGAYLEPDEQVRLRVSRSDVASSVWRPHACRADLDASPDQRRQRRSARGPGGARTCHSCQRGDRQPDRHEKAVAAPIRPAPAPTAGSTPLNTRA